MTHQRLRERAEAYISERDWEGSRPDEIEAFRKAQEDFMEEALPEAILALLAELDAARKDAERYRWLRYHRDVMWTGEDEKGEYDRISMEYLDAAIDAALNADGEKSND